MAIQIRNGTNTEWESNNSNIVAGEPAIATDAERFFVGTASGDYAEFANLDVIAPAYDTSTSYVVGDIINYHGKLYSCNAPCSGAFNVSYWDEKSLAEILKDLENEITYAQYEIGYADGELITIDNGASEIPVKDLTLDIEPVQDLHGYDHPWVGGAGKNKVPYPYLADRRTNNGITYTVNSDGTIVANGTATAVSTFIFVTNKTFLTPNTTYTLSGCDTNGNIYIQLNINNSLYANTSGRKTFTTPSEVSSLGLFIAIRTGETVSNAIFYPQIELGSTATPYEPYSNICPITGWTGAKVSVQGKNLFDSDNLETFSAPSGATTYGHTYKYAGTYAVKAYSTGGSSYLYARVKHADGTWGSSYNIVAQGSRTPSIIEVDDGDILHIFDAVPGSITSAVTKFQTAKMQVVYASEQPADFIPYDGTTYSVTWQTEAGTVYGGTLNVTTGVLTVTHQLFVFDGSSDENWNNVGAGSKGYRSNSINITGTAQPVDIAVKSNEFRGVDYNSRSYNVYDICWVNASGNFVVVTQSDIDTAEKFKTFLAGNPLQILVQIPTQVVQLTPTQVRTVLGTNNIWNNMNSNNELAYRISNALN